MADSSPREYFRNKVRYGQVGHLGTGGMAVVSEVKDEYFQRSVAYKQLKRGSGSRKNIVEFIREALIMGQLQHPGILPVHELIQRDGEMPVITMDKVAGISLAEKITNSQKEPKEWPMGDRIRIFQKLVEVVAYAHSRKILHRDIKPSNVMLGDTGEVILLDWGLAKVQKTIDKKSKDKNASKLLAGDQSVSGSIKGTPYYMSPEAAQGKVEIVKEASDVYGLGAVLYELITLERFVLGTRAVEVLKNAADAKVMPRDLESVQGKMKSDLLKLPREIHTILHRCTQPTIQKRYKNASELHEEIAAYLEDRPLPSQGSMGWRGFTKLVRKNLSPIFMVVLPLIFCIVAVVNIDNEIALQNATLAELEKEEQERVTESEQMEQELAKLSLDKEEVENQILSHQHRRTRMQDEQLQVQDKVAHQEVSRDNLQRDLNSAREDNEILEFDVELLEEELEELDNKLSAYRSSINKEKNREAYEEFLDNIVEVGQTWQRSQQDLHHGELLKVMADLKRDKSWQEDPFAKDWFWQQLKSWIIFDGRYPKEITPELEGADVEVVKEQAPEFFETYDHKNWFRSWGKGRQALVKSSDGTRVLIRRGKAIPLPKLGQAKDVWKSEPEGWVGKIGEKHLVHVDSKGATKEWMHPNAILRFELEDGVVWVEDQRGQVLGYRTDQPGLPWERVEAPAQPWVASDAGGEGEEIASAEGRYRRMATREDGLFWLGRSAVTHQIARYRILDADREPVSPSWSVDHSKPLRAFSDEDEGWWVLEERGSLLFIKQGWPPRRLQLPGEIKALKAFRVEPFNLALVQGEDASLHFYYLNSGQYLFSPGKLPDLIREVVVTEDDRLIVGLERDVWMRPNLL